MKRNAIGMLAIPAIAILLLSGIAVAEQPIGKKFCDVWNVNGKCGIHSGNRFDSRIDDWSKAYTGLETDKYERAVKYLDKQGIDTINVVVYASGTSKWRRIC